jgi:hypothetical protein
VPVPATPDFDHDADTLDRAGYWVVFEEDFTAPALAADRWVAHYLPHWTTPERSAARYALDAGVLTLRIEADQPPGCPKKSCGCPTSKPAPSPARSAQTAGPTATVGG